MSHAITASQDSSKIGRQPRSTNQEIRALIDLTTNIMQRKAPEKKVTRPVSQTKSQKPQQTLNVVQSLFKAQYQSVRKEQAKSNGSRLSVYSSQVSTQRNTLNKSVSGRTSNKSGATSPKAIQRTPSKAEVRYKDQPSPSFASDVSFRELNQDGGGDSSHNASVGVFKTSRSGISSGASAIVIKIENTTHKVSAEIAENQRLAKELALQKKTLQKQIEQLRSAVNKVEKEAKAAKDEIPRYKEHTGALENKITHKRSKSFESLKEITLIKNQIKQLDLDKDQLKQKKEQIQQTMKLEAIRIEGLHQRLAELKA